MHTIYFNYCCYSKLRQVQPPFLSGKHLSNTLQGDVNVSHPYRPHSSSAVRHRNGLLFLLYFSKTLVPPSLFSLRSISLDSVSPTVDLFFVYQRIVKFETKHSEDLKSLPFENNSLAPCVSCPEFFLFFFLKK